MNIPHPTDLPPSPLRPQIPLHPDRPPLSPLRRHQEITHLHRPPFLPLPPNLHHRPRHRRAVKPPPARHNHGKRLPDDLRAGGDADCSCDAVDAVVEPEELVLHHGGVDGGLQGDGVVCDGVAAGAEGTEGEDGGGAEGGVLGLGAGEVAGGARS